MITGRVGGVKHWSETVDGSGDVARSWGRRIDGDEYSPINVPIYSKSCAVS
jgi:hypothetical protein